MRAVSYTADRTLVERQFFGRSGCFLSVSRWHRLQDVFFPWGLKTTVYDNDRTADDPPTETDLAAIRGPYLSTFVSKPRIEGCRPFEQTFTFSTVRFWKRRTWRIDFGLARYDWNLEFAIKNVISLSQSHSFFLNFFIVNSEDNNINSAVLYFNFGIILRTFCSLKMSDRGKSILLPSFLSSFGNDSGQVSYGRGFQSHLFCAHFVHVVLDPVV